MYKSIKYVFIGTFESMNDISNVPILAFNWKIKMVTYFEWIIMKMASMTHP
jgi:hypothetical protein